MSRFNDHVSDSLAAILGSMWFFWHCVSLDVLAIPGLIIQVLNLLGVQLPRWVVAISLVVVVVAFISQTVYQLLALPILQNSGMRSAIKAEKHREEMDARAEARHDKQMEAATRREFLLMRLVEELCEHEGVCVPDEVEGTD